MCCQNHGGEVGAKVTQVHETTGYETEWVALTGFQFSREPLSVALPLLEAAKITFANEDDINEETGTGEIGENQDQLVPPGPEAGVLH